MQHLAITVFRVPTVRETGLHKKTRVKNSSGVTKYQVGYRCFHTELHPAPQRGAYNMVLINIAGRLKED